MESVTKFVSSFRKKRSSFLSTSYTESDSAKHSPPNANKSKRRETFAGSSDCNESKAASLSADSSNGTRNVTTTGKDSRSDVENPTAKPEGDTQTSNPSSSLNSPVHSEDSSTDEFENIHEDDETTQNRPKTYQIAKELVQTEIKYVSRLRLINVDFRKVVTELNNETGIITDAVMRELFSSIGQIHQLNEKLLSELRTRLFSWDENPRICDIMCMFAPFFKTYTTYVSEFERSNTTLQEMMNKYPEFAKAVDTFQKLPKCKNLNIAFHMLSPIQRIPRYRLLMEDYLKNLPTDSDEKEPAEKALKVICDAADRINENMKISDNLNKILNVQRRVRFRKEHNMVIPGRTYIKEGQFQKQSRKELQERMIFLFSDVMLYTEPIGISNMYLFKREFDLKNMNISIPTEGKYPEEKYELQVNHIRKTFRLRAETVEQRDEWVESLKQVIEAAKQRIGSSKLLTPDEAEVIGKQAPFWIPDHQVTMCQFCNYKFNRWHRRHHCRACGKVICNGCSSNLAPLEYKQYEPDRVCDNCYDVLLSGLSDKMNKKDTMHFAILDTNPEMKSTIQSRFKTKDTKSVFRAHKERPSCIDEDTSISGQVEILYRGESKSWKKKGCRVAAKEKLMHLFDGIEDNVPASEVVLLGRKVSTKRNTDEGPGEFIEITKTNQPTICIRPPEEKLDSWLNFITKACSLDDTEPDGEQLDTSRSSFTTV